MEIVLDTMSIVIGLAFLRLPESVHDVSASNFPTATLQLDFLLSTPERLQDVMAPHAEINPQDITERARRDLLQLLEGVRKATWTLAGHFHRSPYSHPSRRFLARRIL